jgi:hypothetical protein
LLTYILTCTCQQYQAMRRPKQRSTISKTWTTINKCFIHAQLCLKSGEINDAVEWQEKAISIFERIDQSKLKKEDMILIKIRYLIAIANIYYIKGDFS